VPQILDHPVSLRLLEHRDHQYPNHFKGIGKGLRLTCVSYVKRRPGYSANSVWMNGSVPQILDHPVSLRLLERRQYQYPNRFKVYGMEGFEIDMCFLFEEEAGIQCWCCVDERQRASDPRPSCQLRLLERRQHQYPNHFKVIWNGLNLTCVSDVRRRPGYSAGAVWLSGSVLQILDHPVSLRLLERRQHQYPNRFKVYGMEGFEIDMCFLFEEEAWVQ
jgi:hypothetical protein